MRGDAPESLGGCVTIRPRGPRASLPGGVPAAASPRGRHVWRPPHPATCLWARSARSGHSVGPFGHNGALWALTLGAVAHPVGMAPHAPTRTRNGGTASPRRPRRRASGPRRTPAGAGTDSRVLASGPGWCLSLRVRRTAWRGLTGLLTPLLLVGVGSCTPTVQQHPDAPAPQTPTSSRDAGSDRGPQFVPSEPPSATVRFYDMHTHERVGARCSKPVGSCD